MNKMVIDVVGAIIKNGDKYLVGRRPVEKTQGGLWEFVGGKIEAGETPEEALSRECMEELNIEIENKKIINSVIHEYPEKIIRLVLIECNPKQGYLPVPIEHQELKWVSIQEMKKMVFCPADAELISKIFNKD